MRPGDRSLLAFVMCLLVCSPAVSSQPDARQDQDRDRDLELELELMRHHQMLQQAARGTGDLSQEWSKRAAEELLARMWPAQAEIGRGSHLLSARMTTSERSVEPPNNVPPRERKAGCKNFYWKGLTSC